MAKTDNLTDFLTGVAGAIRTKKGTTALINPQDFESEIGSIDTAKPEQNKTLTVTENGTQTVKPDTGKVLSNVTVITNVPATPTEEKTVDLAMASGNQVVTPASGKHLTKVTITKPATLAAGNIKSGVNIGGVTGTLSPAKTEQAKTVDLAMASGNQVVSPDSGNVLSSVTITKPTTLVASNIKKGVTIGGVAGSLSPAKPEQSKDVGLDMASGSQVVEPDTGKVLSSVTIYKPTAMIADNIRKGVNIGGVVGTMEAPSLQDSKAVTITSNGTTTITPDAPYDAMKNVSVTVNAAGETVRDFLIPMSMYNLTVSDSHGVIFSTITGTMVYDLPARIIGNKLTLTTSDSHWEALPTFTGTTPTLVSQTVQTLIYELKDGTTGISYIGSASCLIKGTLITLADGSKKPVEDITYDDELLVWNFYKGCFDKAKPRWIKIAQTANVYNKLTFDNGATLGLVGEGGTQGYHRIFNEQARLFTHTGVPETPIGTITFAEDCTKPTLVKQELVHEEVEFYNVITETHFNLFANGILTSCKNSNKYYIENMKYVTDKELMTDAEIEQDMLNREPIKLKKEIK